ncbi:leucine-rich repeat protein [Acetobacterium carbinolicum]|uniref:leucine-rich repeat protein n=1 Tax=Acetobacterium carbinolicum TaxID=52690 RepID=UPI0039C93C34
MKNKLLIWGAFVAFLLFFVPVTALANDDAPGVAYRGHIQDIGDFPAGENGWVQGPEELGTEGQCLRLEGFQIKLTGTIPDGAHIKYNVHVQNVGWLYSETDTSAWASDGAFAGTTARSLRIEAVEIILTDDDDNVLPGYSVKYRGHIQNKGDAPLDGTWLTDGDQLGTVGESLRLEALEVQIVRNQTDLTAYNALLAAISKTVEKDYTATTWASLQNTMADNVMTADNDQIAVNKAINAIQTAFDGLVKKQAAVIYDKAGTYGPATGTETVAGDVIIKADGVILQNLIIQGDLTIAEEVANGTVTLNNLSVDGETFVRGGGINSIHLNGGTYHNVIVEKTATGQVRIVATGVDGLTVVISEDATGETIILEGAFDNVVVNAANMIVTTRGNTTIATMTISAQGSGSTLNLGTQTTVKGLMLDGKTAVKGQGRVKEAAVKANGVIYEKAPEKQTVAPEVTVPPVVVPPIAPPTPPTPGGPSRISVTGVSLDSGTTVGVDITTQLTATVAPANATNPAVSWSSEDEEIAIVDESGKVTGKKSGSVKITVTTVDGAHTATCLVTVATSFEVKNGTITKIDNSSTDIVIPENIDGVPITAIGARTFDGHDQLKNVTIPKTVTSMGWSAFRGCTRLDTVTFEAGSKLTEIGDDAFYGCRSLTTIQIPASVTSMGSSAFLGCTSLDTVTFEADSELTAIGDNAFRGCDSLKEIQIPASVTSMGYCAFSGCTSLNTVTFEVDSALETIDDVAFKGSISLKEIQIPANVTSIGESAFEFSGLNKITFQGKAPNLGDIAIPTTTMDMVKVKVFHYDNKTGFDIYPWTTGYDLQPILIPPANLSVTVSGRHVYLGGSGRSNRLSGLLRYQ